MTMTLSICLKKKPSLLEMEVTYVNIQEILASETTNTNEKINIGRIYRKNIPSRIIVKRIVYANEQPSEDTLDEIIRSHPAAMRFVTPYVKEKKTKPLEETQSESFQHVLDLLHHEDEFLMAAEVGDEERLKKFIARGVDVHQIDSLGRNALHMAVGTGNTKAVLVLLKAGVNPRVKDQIGLTPLSLCLMRRPSWHMASMLFDYGAKILPRNAPTDTGLFLQFVMMCEPTAEEEKLLHLLLEKGALVNDPQAPGGRQALHFAAMSNNCDLIRILLDLGADLFLTNHRNETPKQVAATFKCREAYKLLEERENSVLT